MNKNIVLGQSGGPTAVINSSIVGAFYRAVECDNIDRVYGAYNGILGVLNEELIDLTAQNKKTIDGIAVTPGSALGSCRYRLSEDLNHPDYERIFDVLEAHNVGYFFYNGGNDSMDTAMKLDRYAKLHCKNIKVMGIPKTVDNDLEGTDHCPGYGSAAKYINTAIMEATYDCNTYTSKTVVVMEVMGRHAGWLAASGAAANYDNDLMPTFVYLPEIPFDIDKFLKQVEGAYKKKGKVFVVVSEAIGDSEGNPLAVQSGKIDQFGNVQLGGVSIYLQQLVDENITKRVKLINPGVLQRCAMHCVSAADLDEAYWVGYKAVDYAFNGYSGCMVGIKRLSNRPYAWEPVLVPLDEVANKEKRFPLEWITPEGNSVTKEAIEYIKPLIDLGSCKNAGKGFPVYTALDKRLIDKRLNCWKDK